jgi:hypothetical protein
MSRPQTKQSRSSGRNRPSKPASHRRKGSSELGFGASKLTLAYAGTVATIEEITEEESARDARM